MRDETPPRIGGRFDREPSGGLTCADQGAVVVQRSQVGARQREEGVQPGQVAAEAGPRQHRADDDVPQRVADEAFGGRQTTFRDGKTSRVGGCKNSSSGAAELRLAAMSYYRIL